MHTWGEGARSGESEIMSSGDARDPHFDRAREHRLPQLVGELRLHVVGIVEERLDPLVRRGGIGDAEPAEVAHLIGLGERRDDDGRRLHDDGDVARRLLDVIAGRRARAGAQRRCQRHEHREQDPRASASQRRTRRSDVETSSLGT